MEETQSTDAYYANDSGASEEIDLSFLDDSKSE
jgi:hypothetical protein